MISFKYDVQYGADFAHACLTVRGWFYAQGPGVSRLCSYSLDATNAAQPDDLSYERLTDRYVQESQLLVTSIGRVSMAMNNSTKVNEIITDSR